MGQSIHPTQAGREPGPKKASTNKDKRTEALTPANQPSNQLSNQPSNQPSGVSSALAEAEKKLDASLGGHQGHRSYQQIKTMAETLLREVEHDLPTNLQALIIKYGIELKQKEIAPLTAKLVQTHGGKTVILLNLELSEREQRFALAHALGHYFLEHGNIEDNPESYKRTNLCGESVEANYFTLNVLLPETEIKRCIVNRIATDTEGLTRLFMVSETALMTQLYHLGYIKVLKEKTSKQ